MAIKVMAADELKNLLQAEPFRAFTVYLRSEKAFRVPHSEFALITPNGRTLVISKTDSDAVDILDVPLITRVEVEAQKKS